MKELSAMLADLGCQDIRTFIQSGNVVFRSRKNSASLSREISKIISDRKGFAPHVLVLSRAEFEDRLAKNPFTSEGPDSRALHLGFLDQEPDAPDLKALAKLKSSTEEFQLIGDDFCLLAPDGVGRSKLAAKGEKLLGRRMTDRNWRTVCKIQSLLAELQ
jgi:uncharacterized protein (DUF1697 family)